MRIFKKIIGFILKGLILMLIVFISFLLYITVNEYKPPKVLQLKVNGQSKITNSSKYYSIISWNIGYGGLGKEMDFFYEGGKESRPDKILSDKYFKGIKEFIKSADTVDFIFIQEIDSYSKRSYYRNQIKELSSTLPDFYYTYAINYQVKYIPQPFLHSWGKVNSGIIAFSKMKPESATRFSYPHSNNWPLTPFMLHRCFIKMKYPLSNGKYLVVITTHNSAYDDNNDRVEEMEYLKNILLEEYNLGNYVIVGGDWNQQPPGLKTYRINKRYSLHNVEAIYPAPGWKWVYDKSYPTNRDVVEYYQPGKTKTYIIDFFLHSPNIVDLDVSTFHLNFENSDHNPVFLKFRIKD